jgi:chromosomal replication initiation ATPase DnaA
MNDRLRPARQLPLDLPHRPAMARADFLVGAANEAAIALIDRWPLWPDRGALIAGPVGSGKSHLVEIWRAASGATVFAAAELSTAETARCGAAVAVEDLQAGPFDEKALFHLLNLALERKTAVLLTSRVWPAALPVRLPDLASRLRAMQPVELAEPDDDLLRRVLTKLFADRQIEVDPAVVDYVAVRMERSLAAANTLVDRLDRAALASGRAVSRRLAGIVMAEMFDGQPDFWPVDQ